MAENGRLDTSQLIQAANGAPGQILEAASAASWKAMVQYAASQGIHLAPEPDDGIPSCYRSYAAQQSAYNQLGYPRAAYPGQSNHGWGTAVDVNMTSGVSYWLQDNGGYFGWVNDVSYENWHYHHTGNTGGITVDRSVADIQRLVGVEADGIFGVGTTAAVKSYQSAHGLAADGIWGPASDSVGFGGSAAPAPAPAPAPTSGNLQRGSTGGRVSSLQAGLNRVFPAYSKLAVDGDFGPATESVIKEFQQRVGITADGIVGPVTTQKLAGYGVTF